ncbi:hypothetical protein [Kitasatospora sp. NPDC001527]|uniref:hypothetical protein n=1 Tax=Kitasatospora sp. NPDC001527 TaxID=3154519 RepID=UPI00332F70E2
MAAQPKGPARRSKAYDPRLHELVRDLDTGKTGVYMGTEKGLRYLRPPEGGIEWTVKPRRIEPATPPTTNAA